MKTTFDHVAVRPFLDWFEETAKRDGLMIWNKAGEYGDLDLHAYQLAALHGRNATMPEELERVLAFYAAGKLARIVNALGRGHEPSLDSWRDLACYAMVARRLRETGTWPA